MSTTILTHFDNNNNGIIPNLVPNSSIVITTSGNCIVNGFLNKGIQISSTSTYGTIINNSALNTASGQIDLYVYVGSNIANETILWKNQQYRILLDSGIISGGVYNGSNYNDIGSGANKIVLSRHNKITYQWAENNYQKLYLNGIQVASGIITTVNTNSNDIFLGVKDTGGTKANPLAGTISGIRINNSLDNSNKIFFDTFKNGAKGKGIGAIANYIVNGSLPNGLIAEYLFNTNGNDTSGNNYTAIATDITYSGGVATFNSHASRIDLSGSIANNNSNLTICMWVKFTSRGDGEYFLFQTNGGSYPRVDYWSGGQQFEGSSNSYIDSVVIPLDTWVFVALTLFHTKPTTLWATNVWYDGVFGAGNNIFTTDGTVDSLVLGWWNNSNHGLMGDMDTIRVFNRGLSSDEIQTVKDLGR